MSVGKKNHARDRLVHHSASRCLHGPSGWDGATAAPGRSGPATTVSTVTDRRRHLHQHLPDSEDATRAAERSAECRCHWPRSAPARPADLAGSPGHGPGRPARPAGAECCGTPGRGSERPAPAPARRRPRPPAALRHLVLLLLLSSVFRIAECCSSRANPKPRDPSPSTRRPYTFKTEACPDMYQAHYCLNGATCFKVNIGRNPLYNCECADGFMGQRCEFKDPDGSYSRPQGATLEQASIAGGAGVALLVCLLLSGLLYVWSKRRRKTAASSTQLTPRFSLRRPTSHVVQMEPAAANQQPGTSDVIELQPADRWTPPPPPPPAAVQECTSTVPADSTAAAAAGPPASETSAPPDPQSRPCDRPP